ncbi:MAG: dockerin type I domain-containing protein [Porcipelethomonas sp.]
MIKKIKPVIKRLCIFAVLGIFCALSAAVIAGSAVKNDDMKYSVGIVDGEGEVLDIVPVGIGIRGDADSDGKVSARDASQIARYLANSSVNKNYMPGYDKSLGGAMADANNDGKLSVRDAAAVAKYLSNKFSNPNADWDD